MKSTCLAKDILASSRSLARFIWDLKVFTISLRSETEADEVNKVVRTGELEMF